MKKYLYLALIIVVYISCNENTQEAQVDLSNKSIFYKETILKQGGDFLSLNLGDKMENASKVLPKDILQQNEKNYQFYKSSNTFSVAEYQLIYEKEKLVEIDFDVFIYDEKGNFDTDGALELFNELKEDFLKKFGNKYMESSDTENEILYWSKDNKNVQLILEKAAVHAYLDIVVE